MNFYEELTENFHRWERRGRGTLLFDAPVEVEPPFVPFPGHRIDFGENPDDGTKHTVLSGLVAKIGRLFQPPPAPRKPSETEPVPVFLDAEDDVPHTEFRVLLPPDATVSAARMAHFLTTLTALSYPVALEMLGLAGEISLQLTAHPDDADTLAQQLEAQFPEARVEVACERLLNGWLEDFEESEYVIVDFGLSREFMMPLDTDGKIDPFGSLAGGMSSLTGSELALYQVIFTPLQEAWAENAFRSVTRSDGTPFFSDGVELLKWTKEKLDLPLFGVTLRLSAKAADSERAWDMVRDMAPALRPFTRHRGQSFEPLPGKDYELEEHQLDVLSRRSRRPGMILNLAELLGLAHWPAPTVKTPKFLRLVETRTRRAPACDQPEGIVLGVNEHEGDEQEVRLSPRQRLQHIHCIGGSGTGKSSLLLSMMRQDLENGQGFALIDPHGDLADRVMSEIPYDLSGDVIVVDPSDEGFITPFNVLSASSDHEKNLLASDLVSVFRRLSTTWGDHMEIIFKNLVLAFLEHPQGGTLPDLRRFLVDVPWRMAYLAGVTDSDVRWYWEQVFPKIDGQRSVGPILTRLEALLTPKIIRYMVSQREGGIPWDFLMNKRGVLIVRLPMGQIGKENAFMLGSLIMVKLQQMAMGRARMAEKDRKPFFCYVDECQHFVTPSMAEILSGARKYGLGLVLAHQDLHQLSHNKDVEAAVMTNAATRIVFRISESDARSLKGDFAHYDLRDFAELPNLYALARIGSADRDFNLRIVRPDDPDPEKAEARRLDVLDENHRFYTIPRAQVEAEILRRLEEDAARSKTAKPEKAKKGKAPAEAEPKPEPPPSPESPRSPESSPTSELGTPQVSPPPTVREQSAGNSGDPPPPAAPPKLGTPQVSAPPNESEAPPAETQKTTRSPGMGVGGSEHQLIVRKLADAAGRLGFVVQVEEKAAAGRVDLALVFRGRRFALEVAVHSNTAHELENLSKCLGAGYDYVVSVSADANALKNIERAARKTLTPESLSKLKFLPPEAVALWLEETAATLPPVPALPRKTHTYGGRRAVVERVAISPAAEERNHDEIRSILSKK